MPDSPFADRLARLRDRIDAAASRAGRSVDAITLIAVSKTHPVESVTRVLAAGQLDFGENRVAEAADKFSSLRPTYSDLRLHLIGGLQTNKAADAIRLADVIHSLDRPRLLSALAAEREQQERMPSVLVQVNVGDEPQKSGIPRAQADEFIVRCRETLGSAVRGLMCVPPLDADPMPYFAWLAALAARHGLEWLSMGMSGDFEAAVTAGATHLRIGSALFGAR